jgi:ribosomal protein S27E
MLDMLLHSAYPAHHFERFISGRCHRCDQGMIVAGDDFMMVRCDNCGRYLSNSPSDLGFGLRLVNGAIRSFFRAVKQRASRLVKTPPSTTNTAKLEGA